MILEKSRNQLDNINSTFVKKVWKELCNDKKYSHICHFEDEIMNKIEISLHKYSKNMKLKHMNQCSSHNYNNEDTINHNYNNENTMNQNYNNENTINNNYYTSNISCQNYNTPIKYQDNTILNNSNNNKYVYNIPYENTSSSPFISNNNIKCYPNMHITMTPPLNNYSLVSTESSLMTTNINSVNMNYSLLTNPTEKPHFLPGTNSFYHHQIPAEYQHQITI